MREIEFSRQFEKDYKRTSRSPTHKDLDERLIEIIDLLCSDKKLPARNRDHNLKGEYVGTRECFIKPDLLLIYFKTGREVLTLVRLGTHSELF